MATKEQLIQLRKDKGLTQFEFAEKTGVARSTIADIERGRIPLGNKTKQKIVESLGLETGYFEVKNVQKESDLKQGIETGSWQGYAFKSTYRTIDSEIEPYRLDATKLNYDEVVSILTEKGGQVTFINLSNEITEKLNQLFEKQCFVAEKALKEIQVKDSDFLKLKRSLEAIKLFQNLLDNVTNSTEINDLFSINGTARANFSQSLAETKIFLQNNFEKLRPYAPIFNDLAQAMVAFANLAKSIPQDITGIDREEFDEYIDLTN